MLNLDVNQNSPHHMEKTGPGSATVLQRPIILNKRSSKTLMSERQSDQYNIRTGFYNNHGKAVSCLHQHKNVANEERTSVANEEFISVPSNEEQLMPVPQLTWSEQVSQLPAASLHSSRGVPAFLHRDALATTSCQGQQQPYVLVPCGTTVNNGYQGELLLLKQQPHYSGACGTYCAGKCKAGTGVRKMPHVQTWKQFSPDEESIQTRFQLPVQPNLVNMGQLSGVNTAPQLYESGDGKQNTMNDSLTTITWLGHMDTHRAMPCTSVAPMKHKQLQRCRPPYSYMALIQFAINSSPMHRMTLRQIYSWIEERFPYFKHAKPGWKNSIRHNLSLHDIFIREVLPASKASYWTIRPDVNQRPLTLDCVMRAPYNHFVKSDELGQSFLQTHEEIQPCAVLPLPSDPPKPASFAQISSLVNSELSPIPSKHVKIEQPGTSMSSFLHFGQNEMPSSERQIVEIKENSSDSRKRRRKQPMKTLNDSLNDSLHFTDPIPGSPLDSPSSDFEFLTDASKVPFIKTKNRSTADGDISCFERSPCPTIRKRGSTLRLNSDVEASDQRQESSVRNISDRESPLEDCIPQIFGRDTFAFNSSFSRFLSANSVSLFNSSGLSGLFSDGEEATQNNAPEP